MEDDVGVGVSDQSLFVWNVDAPEDESLTHIEAVHVISDPNSHAYKDSRQDNDEESPSYCVARTRSESLDQRFHSSWANLQSRWVVILKLRRLPATT